MRSSKLSVVLASSLVVAGLGSSSLAADVDIVGLQLDVNTVFLNDNMPRLTQSVNLTAVSTVGTPDPVTLLAPVATYNPGNVIRHVPFSETELFADAGTASATIFTPAPSGNFYGGMFQFYENAYATNIARPFNRYRVSNDATEARGDFFDFGAGTPISNGNPRDHDLNPETPDVRILNTANAFAESARQAVVAVWTKDLFLNGGADPEASISITRNDAFSLSWRAASNNAVGNPVAPNPNPGKTHWVVKKDGAYYISEETHTYSVHPNPEAAADFIYEVDNSSSILTTLWAPIDLLGDTFSIDGSTTTLMGPSGAYAPLSLTNLQAVGFYHVVEDDRLIDQNTGIRVNRFFVNATVGSAPVEIAWAADADGAWGTGSNWTGGTSPNGAAVNATLGNVVTAARTVSLDTSVTLGTLSVNSGTGSYVIDLAGPGKLSVATLDVAGGRLDLDDAADSAAVAGSVSIATGAVLNLKGATLVVDYASTSPLADLVAAHLAGRLTSDEQAVGLVEASALGVTSFGGATVDATAVLARGTLRGDTDLSGGVDFTDLLAMAQSYNLPGQWNNGDFDYDGTVGFADLLALAQNYGASLLVGGGLTVDPALAAQFHADWTAALAVVPEPASLGLLAGLGTLALRRRG
jgi:hypothetical protein